MRLIVACQATLRAPRPRRSRRPCVPSSAEPSGDVGDTVPAAADRADLDGHLLAASPSTSTTEPIPDLVRAGVLDDLGAVEPRAQRADPRLEQALLVLRSVVLEVLRQVAELARLLDRRDDLACGAGPRARRAPSRSASACAAVSCSCPTTSTCRRAAATCRRRAASRPSCPDSSKRSTWPCSRATRETSACCSGSTSVMPDAALARRGRCGRRGACTTSGSSGGSKLITCVMSSTSRPRAATSVATSVRTLPESKCASARSR